MIDSVFVFYPGYEDVIHNGIIDVLAPQLIVPGRIRHLHDPFIHLHQGCVESTASQIEDQPVALHIFTVHPIGKGCCNGLLKQFAIFEPCHFRGPLGGIDLVLPEFRRDRNGCCGGRLLGHKGPEFLEDFG